MIYKLDKQLILESRVVGSYSKDGKLTQHFGAERLKKKKQKSERVIQNELDFKNQLDKQKERNNAN